MGAWNWKDNLLNCYYQDCSPFSNFSWRKDIYGLVVRVPWASSGVGGHLADATTLGTGVRHHLTRAA